MLHDIRFALRRLVKSPGFALAAIGTAALGIGANTAIFSVVSGVLLRPLPFADPDRLVQLQATFPPSGIGAVALPDVEEWNRQSSSFESFVAYNSFGKNLEGIAEPERIMTIRAERGLFRMLGVEARLGRTFRDDDPLQVAVIGARAHHRLVEILDENAGAFVEAGVHGRHARCEDAAHQQA